MMFRWPWVSRQSLDIALVRLDVRTKRAEAAERNVLALTEATSRAEQSAIRWESLVRQWTQTFEDAKEQLERSEARYDTLLSRYQQLKLQGFSEPVAPVARPQVQPDPIKRAIAQRAGTNRQLREAMERQVAQDRLLGKSDEEILSAIIAGVSGEDLILSEAGLMSP